jgi:hypothetical protein
MPPETPTQAQAAEARRFRSLYEAACGEIRSLERRYVRALRALAEARAEGVVRMDDRDEAVYRALEDFEADLDTPDLALWRDACREAARRA